MKCIVPVVGGATAEQEVMRFDSRVEQTVYVLFLSESSQKHSHSFNLCPINANTLVYYMGL